MQYQSERSTKQNRRGYQVLRKPMEWVEKISPRNPRWLHPRPDRAEPKSAIALAYTFCPGGVTGQQQICPKYASPHLLWTNVPLEVERTAFPWLFTDSDFTDFKGTLDAEMKRLQSAGVWSKKDRRKCWRKKMRSNSGRRVYWVMLPTDTCRHHGLHECPLFSFAKWQRAHKIEIDSLRS